MIGIDIVDLSDPLLHKRGNRAVELILNSTDQYPEDLRAFWLIWTAKETIFKSRRTTHPFSPTEIHIEIEKRSHGIFHYQSDQHSGLILSNHHFVCAIGGVEKLPDFRIFYHKKASDRAFIRQKIDRSLDHTSQLSTDDLGLPIISPTRQLISISHHRHYAAFAISSQTLQ